MLAPDPVTACEPIASVVVAPVYGTSCDKVVVPLVIIFPLVPLKTAIPEAVDVPELVTTLLETTPLSLMIFPEVRLKLHRLLLIELAGPVTKSLTLVLFNVVTPDIAFVPNDKLPVIGDEPLIGKKGPPDIEDILTPLSLIILPLARLNEQILLLVELAGPVTISLTVVPFNVVTPDIECVPMAKLPVIGEEPLMGKKGPPVNVDLGIPESSTTLADDENDTRLSVVCEVDILTILSVALVLVPPVKLPDE